MSREEREGNEGGKIVGMLACNLMRASSHHFFQT